MALRILDMVPDFEQDLAEPTVITVPGLGGSGETHWQTLWEASRRDTVRADLGRWSAPDRDIWVARLDEAVRRARVPVILAAHSLGCHAVAWWAKLSPGRHGGRVIGALLVAPPDLDSADAPAEVRGFAPAPRAALPFRSILVASANDPWTSLDRAQSLARVWGSRFVDAGPLGLLNAASGIGAWPEGEALLARLVIGSDWGDPNPIVSGERVG